MKRLGVATLCVAMLTNCAYDHFDGVLLQPCDNRPPASAEQPITVPVSILEVPGHDMFVRCRKQNTGIIIYGCTFPPFQGHQAVVLLNSDMNQSERDCTLIYEKAHLPPNNWSDQVMEARALDAPLVSKPRMQLVSTTASR